jgi:cytoskeletal protein RodZ
MHKHHSVIRLALGFGILLLLGLATYFVLLYMQSAPPATSQPVRTPTAETQTSPTGTASSSTISASASSSEQLMPGLFSDTPPPGR